MLHGMGIIWVEYYYHHKNQGGIAMNIRPSAAIRQNYNEIADMSERPESQCSLLKMVREIWLLWILEHIIVEKKC